MAASNPQFPDIVTFTLGGTSFKEDLVSLAIVPIGVDGKSVLTLDGVNHARATVARWELQGTAVVDWDTSRPGLAYKCFNDEGDSVAFVYLPNASAISATNPAANGNCRLSPIAFGGDGNDYATFDFVFPVDGALTLDTTP